MADEILILGLRRKYAQLAGEARAARQVLETAQADMATIQATLRIFRADADLDGIRPIAPPQPGRWFAKGQCFRAVLTILRRANEPLTSAQIVERVVTETAINPTSPADLRSVREAIKHVLAKRTVIAKVEGTPMRWALASSVGGE